MVYKIRVSPAKLNLLKETTTQQKLGTAGSDKGTTYPLRYMNTCTNYKVVPVKFA